MLTFFNLPDWAMLAIPLVLSALLLFNHLKTRALPQTGHTWLSAADRQELKRIRDQAIAAMYGVNRSVDLVEAEELFREAYSKGDCLAGMWFRDMLAYQPGKAAEQEANTILENCGKLIERLTDSGDPEAGFLCCNSLRGKRSNQDRYWQMETLKHSCAAGFMPAWVLRGKLEYLLCKNPAKAMKWYRRAAQHGSAIALAGVALVLCDDKYEGYNPTEGLAILERGAAADDQVAMLWLARYYLNEKFGELQPRLARKHLNIAIQLGDYRALVDLARLHLDGIGGPVDIVEARRLLHQAKEFSGETRARKMLSELESRLEGESS